MQSLEVVILRKVKVLIALVVLVVLSVTTYAYIRKRPVETIPERATLVMREYERRSEGCCNEGTIQTAEKPFTTGAADG